MSKPEALAGPSSACLPSGAPRVSPGSSAVQGQPLSLPSARCSFTAPSPWAACHVAPWGTHSSPGRQPRAMPQPPCGGRPAVVALRRGQPASSVPFPRPPLSDRPRQRELGCPYVLPEPLQWPLDQRRAPRPPVQRHGGSPPSECSSSPPPSTSPAVVANAATHMPFRSAPFCAGDVLL